VLCEWMGASVCVWHGSSLTKPSLRKSSRGRVPKQVIPAAKPSSQGLSRALSEQRAFLTG
jgi:hypothetical protein